MWGGGIAYCRMSAVCMRVCERQRGKRLRQMGSANRESGQNTKIITGEARRDLGGIICPLSFANVLDKETKMVNWDAQQFNRRTNRD